MSSSLSMLAKAVMMGLTRLPDLKSCSCLIKYSGCCWANFGLAGMSELPSAEWQAAQTAPKLASPFAKSGLAAAVACLASSALTENMGDARAIATKRVESNFILVCCVR